MLAFFLSDSVLSGRLTVSDCLVGIIGLLGGIGGGTPLPCAAPFLGGVAGA